jgi:hypothetical protein
MLFSVMLHKTKKRSVVVTETQLRSAGHGELGSLRDRIEAELARRELADTKLIPGRQIVEERPASAGTLRLEMVKCGKDRCKKCERGEGHGPYWYLYFRRNGKLTSRYIGKMIPEDLRRSEAPSNSKTHKT